MKMKLFILLSAYAVPMLAMQTPSYVIGTKNDVQRKTIEQLQKSIKNLHNAVDSVKDLENLPSEEDEVDTFLERFRTKLALNEQELIERQRHKRVSDFHKSDYKQLI